MHLTAFPTAQFVKMKYQSVGSKRNTNTKWTKQLMHSDMRRLRFSVWRIRRPCYDRSPSVSSAGINAGVRVLDLGCGAGDVSMLAAELVGPGGSVVGIDRSQEVLKVARERAQEAGLRQIRFVRSSVKEFVVDEPFDLVIGRYILVHQSEPVATGVTKSFPCVPLWDLTINLVRIALQSSVSNYDGADRLGEHFPEAGLPYPNLFCEELVGAARIHSSWFTR
jgi:SAM-dependent methyltransferase